MNDYSIIPFLLCLGIFVLTTILSTIFIREGNVWAMMLIGAAGLASVVTVNEIAQRIKENKE